MKDLDLADMRQFFERVPALVMVIDREYRFQYVNPAYERLINRPINEILGRTVEEIRGSDFFVQLRPHIDAALNGETIACEVHADVTPPLPWFEARYFPHYDAAGEIDGVYLLSVETTEQKQREDKLRASEMRLQLALDIGGIGVWEWDAVTRTSVWDRRVEEMFGFRPGEYDGRFETYIKMLHPDDAEKQVAFTTQISATGVSTVGPHDEFRIYPKTGGMRWIRSLWIPHYDGHGRMIGGIGTLLDITHWKDAEEKRREDQRQLEQLLHEMQEERRILSEAERIAQMGSWQYHDGLKTFSGSDNMYTLYGRNRALGPPTFEEWSALIHDEDRTKVMSTISHALKSGENYTLDYRIRHGISGDIRHMHSEVEVSTDLDGHRKLLGSVQDVTDQIEASRKLQASEALLRQIIDTSPNSIFIKDRDGRYLLVSRYMARSHGMTPEELIGKRDRDLVRNWHADERFTEHREGERAVIEQQRPLYIPESEFAFANGSRRWFQTTKMPFNFAGDPNCILVISVDITERKQIEQQLQMVNESLERERTALEEKNVTLRTILTHLEESREEYRKKICEDISRTLMPAVEKLRQKSPKSRELSKIETGLRAIADDGGNCQEGDVTTLSPREVEIYQMIGKGKTSKEIADALSISLQTVHKHRSSIRRKLRIENTSVNLTNYARSRPIQ